MPFASRFVAIVTLGLTIGAVTTGAAVVRRAVLAGVAVGDPAGLYQIEPLRPLPGRGDVVFNDSLNNCRLFAASTQLFRAVGCAFQANIGWDDHGEARPLQVASVTQGFFGAMDVAPALGRVFTVAEDTGTPARVVILSHHVAVAAFGGDRAAVGRLIRLGGDGFTVIGVVDDGFALPAVTEAWLPLGVPAFAPTGRVVSIVARLQPGAAADVSAAMRGVTTLTMTADSVSNKDYHYQARHLGTVLFDGADRTIWIFAAGSLVLYLLAISNVWLLFLAWAIERAHDTAVRRALGASTRRIVQLFLARSLTIAIPGGALGCLAAALAVRGVRALRINPVLTFLLARVSVGAVELTCAVALAILAMLVVALLTAWGAIRADARASGVNVAASARGASPSRGAARWQRGLVLTQHVFTVVIVFAGVLSGLSLWHLAQVSTGFESSGRAVARVALTSDRYAAHAARAAFGTRLLDALAQQPELADAGFTTTLPVSDVLWGGRYLPMLGDGSLARDPVTLHYRRISPGYLRTMGIAIEEGRDFDSRDAVGGQLVAIVSRATADHFFPGADAIGQPLHRFQPGATTAPPVLTVVGVTRNVMDAGVTGPIGEAVYVPFAQASYTQISVVGRARSTPDAALASIRRAVQAVDPTVAAFDTASLQELTEDATAIPRLQTWLLVSLAAIALALTALGTYGVISQHVGSRRRELATRLALGATSRGLRGLVLADSLRLAVLGTGIGAGGSWLAGHAFTPLVFGVSATSPHVLILVAGGVLALATVATAAPAFRAGRVDPRHLLGS